VELENYTVEDALYKKSAWGSTVFASFSRKDVGFFCNITFHDTWHSHVHKKGRGIKSHTQALQDEISSLRQAVENERAVSREMKASMERQKRQVENWELRAKSASGTPMFDTCSRCASQSSHAVFFDFAVRSLSPPERQEIKRLNICSR
jgi:hypothetical protein